MTTPGGVLGEHAVVCGAGMAGLLATRVLAQSYKTVTLVERDHLTGDVAQRNGVPQGRHFHVLSIGGSHLLEEFFPGLLRQLRAAGATVCDDGNLSRISLRGGGYELNRSGRFADPDTVVMYLASRPLLEFHVRQRIRQLPNVAVLDGYDVVEPVAAQDNRVTGVRVADRGTGARTVLGADLVVEAMGRGARMPAFLSGLGYGRPPEHRAVTRGSYSSQLLRVAPGEITEKLTFVGPEAHRPTGAALSAYENDTWMLSVGCVDGRLPPDNFDDILELFAEFAPAALVSVLRSAEPLAPVSVIQHRGAWRRYDKMPAVPNGLLAFGDSVCSLNPIYGQGMTMAALQAVALGRCLQRGDHDLGRRFYRAATRVIQPTWLANQTSDFATAVPDGRRRRLQKLTAWGIGKMLAAAEDDAALSEKVFRAGQFLDAPSVRQGSAVATRAIAHYLPGPRRRART